MKCFSYLFTPFALLSKENENENETDGAEVSLHVKVMQLTAKLRQLKAVTISQGDAHKVKVQSLLRTKSAAEEELKLLEEVIMDQPSPPSPIPWLYNKRKAHEKSSNSKV
jgi:hypothetical protein